MKKKKITQNNIKIMITQFYQTIRSNTNKSMHSLTALVFIFCFQYHLHGQNNGNCGTVARVDWPECRNVELIQFIDWNTEKGPDGKLAWIYTPVRSENCRRCDDDNNCPSEYRQTTPGGYPRSQCTAWANYRTKGKQNEGFKGEGNGGEWGVNAKCNKGSLPVVGAILSEPDPNGFGHVSVVECVNQDNSEFIVSEYNACPCEFSLVKRYTDQLPPGSLFIYYNIDEFDIPCKGNLGLSVYTRAKSESGKKCDFIISMKGSTCEDEIKEYKVKAVYANTNEVFYPETTIPAKEIYTTLYYTDKEFQNSCNEILFTLTQYHLDGTEDFVEEMVYTLPAITYKENPNDDDPVIISYQTFGNTVTISWNDACDKTDEINYRFIVSEPGMSSKIINYNGSRSNGKPYIVIPDIWGSTQFSCEVITEIGNSKSASAYLDLLFYISPNRDLKLNKPKLVENCSNNTPKIIITANEVKEDDQFFTDIVYHFLIHSKYSNAEDIEIESENRNVTQELLEDGVYEVSFYVTAIKHEVDKTTTPIKSSPSAAEEILIDCTIDLPTIEVIYAEDCKAVELKFSVPSFLWEKVEYFTLKREKDNTEVESKIYKHQIDYEENTNMCYYRDEEITDHGTYFYSLNVKYSNHESESSFTEPQSISTNYLPPEPPGEVEIVIEDYNASIEFTDLSVDEDYFILERMNPRSNKYEVKQRINSNNKTSTGNVLTFETDIIPTDISTVRYRVRSGRGEDLECVSFESISPKISTYSWLKSPRDLRITPVTQGPGDEVLTWKYDDIPGTTLEILRKNIFGDDWQSPIETEKDGIQVFSSTLGPYKYKIRAKYINQGNSISATTYSKCTGPVQCDIDEKCKEESTPPDPPSITGARTEGGNLHLRWTTDASQGGFILKYKIISSSNPSDNWTVFDIFQSNSSSGGQGQYSYFKTFDFSDFINKEVELGLSEYIEEDEPSDVCSSDLVSPDQHVYFLDKPRNVRARIFFDRTYLRERVEVKWTGSNNKNEDGYQVMVSLNEGVWQELYQCVDKTIINYDFQPDQTMKFCVRAIKKNVDEIVAISEWGYSESELDATKPNNIEDFKVAVNSKFNCDDNRWNEKIKLPRTGNFILYWKDNSTNEQTYHIKIINIQSLKIECNKWIKAKDEDVPDIGMRKLAINTNLFAGNYRVEWYAHNAYGDCNTVTYNIFAPRAPCPPLPVAKLRAVRRCEEPEQITLTWEDVSEGENTESAYWVYRRDPGDSYFHLLTKLAQDVESYIDKSFDLDPNESYEYKVKSYTCYIRKDYNEIDEYGNDVCLEKNFVAENTIPVPACDKTVKFSGLDVILCDDNLHGVCNIIAYYLPKNPTPPPDPYKKSASKTPGNDDGSDFAYHWYKDGKLDIIFKTGQSITVPTRPATYTVRVKSKDGTELASKSGELTVTVRDCKEPRRPCMGCGGGGFYGSGSGDPNDMIGPEGYGPSRWVSVNDVLNYTVLFENDPEIASAAAQRVSVRVPLDEHLNMYSLRLSAFGFANQIFEMAENTFSYSQKLNMHDTLGVDVEVLAGLDMQNREAFWIFQSIDPATGMASEQTGFLPINDSLLHDGEGFVSFSAVPLENSETGDSIKAFAGIIFDENEEIKTPQVFNTIDAHPPVSEISSIEYDSKGYYNVTTTADDDPGGCGVNAISIYQSVDEGPLQKTAESASGTKLHIYIPNDHTYTLYSAAQDYTGNTETLNPVSDQEISTGQIQFSDTHAVRNYCYGSAIPIHWSCMGIDTVDILLQRGTTTKLLTRIYAKESPYLWNIPDTLTPGTIVFRIADMKDYSRSVQSDSYSIYEDLSLQVSDNMLICKGDVAHLSASGGDQYQWWPAGSLNESDIANPIASPTTSTWYYVTANTNFGCDTKDSVYIQVMDTCSVINSWEEFTKIDGKTIKAIELFPNPTEGKLNIKIRLSERTDLTIDLYTIAGVKLEEIEKHNIRNETIELNLDPYLAGTYIIKISGKGILYTEHVVLQNNKK